jgi:hypothetical protein
MTSKSKSKWQKGFLRDVFRQKHSSNDTYSKIIQNNLELLQDKQKYLPKKVCKFYAPTSDNILDIQKQRIWLAHPNSFNDPFDCHVGYDIEEYEKQCLTKYLIKKLPTDFTSEEIDRIKRSKTFVHYLESMYRGTEEYYDVKRKLLDQKSDKLQTEIRDFISKITKDIDIKIEKIRNTNIRVACFSDLIDGEDYKKNITMWSHYAANHKGFCVEYDFSSLKENTEFTVYEHEYYDETLQKTYLKERLLATTKAGLFPVMYTSNRVNIPFTKLMKIKYDTNGELQHRPDIDAIIYKTYLVKSSNWSYEKEWRLILDIKISKYYDNKVPFPYISRIYLGCKIDQQIKNTIIEIGKDLNFEVIQLLMDNKKFILEEESSYLVRDREWQRKYNNLNPFR